MSNMSYSAVTLDSNVWYHVTEARVDDYNETDFANQLQVEDDDGLAVWGVAGQYWQFQPVEDGSKGRYAMRCSDTGVDKQLSACYVSDEIDSSRTQPCMLASNGDKAQMWDVTDWGNGTYRFLNAKNGSNYVMDVHPGNPPYMSSDLRTSIPQPGRHWLMTSAKNVDDGAYSTVFTNIPTSTSVDANPTGSGSTSGSSSPSSSSSSSSSSRLSAGAAAGIGVGAGLAVVGLGLGLFLLWRRRRRSNPKPSEMHVQEPVHPNLHNSHSAAYYYHPPPPQEMFAAPDERSELDSKSVPGTTPTPESAARLNRDECANAASEQTLAQP